MQAEEAAGGGSEQGEEDSSKGGEASGGEDEHGAKARVLMEEAGQLVKHSLERRNRAAARRDEARIAQAKARPGVLSNEEVARILGY